MIPAYVDMLPQQQEMVICSVEAAAKYQLPPNVMLAIASQEGGRPGQWVENKNGTYDVGPMQFNTAYLRDLQKHGIRPEHVEAPGCYPYQLAAWRLRIHLNKDRGEFWERIANYHSRTRKFNLAYQTKIKDRAARWEEWLQIHNTLISSQRLNKDIKPKIEYGSPFLTTSSSTNVSRSVAIAQ